MAADLIPVFSIDPNGPWRQIGDVVCLVVGVYDPDLQVGLVSGEIAAGDPVFLFQPNERDGMQYTEEGWGTLGRLVEFSEYKDPHQYVVYLDIDPK